MIVFRGRKYAECLRRVKQRRNLSVDLGACSHELAAGAREAAAGYDAVCFGLVAEGGSLGADDDVAREFADAGGEEVVFVDAQAEFEGEGEEGERGGGYYYYCRCC